MNQAYIPLESKELFRYLISKWKLIVGITTASALIGLVVLLFFVPNYYASYANLLPVQKKTIGLGLIGGSSLSKAAGSLLSGDSDEVDRFYIILESRTLREKMVNKFDLISVYGVQDTKFPLLTAIKKLDENTVLKDYTNGNFTITVLDKDPARAQAMCTYYLELLNEVNDSIEKQESTQFRAFLETRYTMAMAQLDSLTTELKKFQEQYGVFDLTNQAKQYYTLMSEASAQLIMKELAYEFAKKQLKPTQSEYVKIEQEYEIVKRKVDDLFAGKSDNPLVLNFSALPDIAKKNVDIQVNLEIQEEILKVIVPLFEQAKMEEAKSLSIINIIDQPNFPIRKDWPPRAAYLIAITITTLLVLIVGLTISLIIKTNKSYYNQFLS